MHRECRERFLRVSVPDMHHGTCVTRVPWCISGSIISCFFWSWWRIKRSRHSRYMRNPQIYVSGNRPMHAVFVSQYARRQCKGGKTHHWKNKANLRELIAATGVVILLKLNSNRRFFARVTFKFDGWPRKIIRHVFYTTWSFVYHFISISEFKLEIQSGNAQSG